MTVILAAATVLAGTWLGAQVPMPQFGRKAAVDKGPRALGLVQLSPTGKKARFIPIAIMMDGKFYDASSYKASPVPMALDFGVVYEGFRSGVSQGVFTITQPGQLNHSWIAEGTWLPAGAPDPTKHKKYSPPKIEDEDKEGPPVLHRRSDQGDSEGKDKENNKGKDKNKDKDDKDKDKDKGQSTPATPPNAPAPAQPPDAAKAPAAPETAKASVPDEPISDPNRPRLRRGKPDPTAHQEPFARFDALTATAPASTGAGKPDAKDSGAAAPPIITMTAISDAGGPDARPYTYDIKPVEEAIYRNKMLDLAATLVRSQAGAAKDTTAQAAANKSGSKAFGKPSSKSSSKPIKPAFDDVNLRIFDLSNSNEPVLVLSAKTQPPAGSASGGVEEPKEITLIARTNLEGELRKLFFSQTDSRHLDVTPRMELIDAIDADGDGRGELLFRRSFDDGSAYAIYRVTADRLWALFEGTP